MLEGKRKRSLIEFLFMYKIWGLNILFYEPPFNLQGVLQPLENRLMDQSMRAHHLTASPPSIL